MRSSIVVCGIADAVAEGYRLNIPLREVSGDRVESVVASDNPAIVVETVKLAADRSGDVVIRLHEAHGTRSAAAITASFGYTGVIETDLLERALSRRAVEAGDRTVVRLNLGPFELVTLRFSVGGNNA